MVRVLRNAQDQSTNVKVRNNAISMVVRCYSRASRSGGDSSELHKASSGKGHESCQLLTKKEDLVKVPGCSTWVLANAGAGGFSVQITSRTQFVPWRRTWKAAHSR